MKKYSALFILIITGVFVCFFPNVINLITQRQTAYFENGNVSNKSRSFSSDRVMTKIEERVINDSSFAQIRNISSPSGSVKTIRIDLLPDMVNVVDLLNYNFQYFAFRWSGSDFSYGFSAVKSVVPTLVKIESNDDLGEITSLKTSDLLIYSGKRYLFIESEEKSIEIDLIDVGDTKHQILSSSNYSSGPKYSSLNIIPRETWSGDPNINDPRLIENGGRLVWEPFYYSVNKVVIHHTTNTNNYTDPASQVRGIYNYHAYSLGWGDIGYNYLIDWRGNIYEGKLGGEEAKGYHAGVGNANSIGIAMIGTFINEIPTQAAQESLIKLIAEKAAFYGFTPKFNINPNNIYDIRDSTVLGHRNFQATECPGNSLYSILSSIASNSQSYMNTNFAYIKDLAAKIDNSVNSGNYENDLLLVLFYQKVDSNLIGKYFPFYNGIPSPWNGISKYYIRGDMVYFYFDYSTYGTQSNLERIRTLSKVFTLRNDVRAGGPNFIYSVNNAALVGEF